MSDLILLIEREGWTEIVLNHPPTRNAITGPFGEQLSDAINAANEDEKSRLILLRGAEGVFCSGLNLKEFNRDPPPEWMPGFQKTWRGVHRALYDCRKPVVVALERFAINGGAALALAGDLLIVGDDSYLQVGEVRQGMAAPYNMAWLRLRFSENVIAQVALVGKQLTGSELHRLGVAYAAPTTSEVVETATKLCEELASYPQNALVRIKSIMRGYQTATADEWFDQATDQLPAGRSKPQRVR